ncbi:hypothetical protein [Couchioplanes azureus]|uniref:hypothetical protein n=1 Tax=Couchioplanes caeruleus TaxID=56438 RepID=UPI0016706688|nr:hypothetical protein [Couchioplanes caeruleus]GGQ80748.1 hypothetical protein GCM10010166_58540 [Couchioplanes caeruleus subsp. azureus]
MSSTPAGDTSGFWLAGTVLRLLEERYGRGRVPSVRVLSRDIRDANDGDTISHGHMHNILSGGAVNITDRTRAVLARFLGVPPTALMPSAEQASAPAGPPSAETLAMRFSSLRPEELAAIEKAIHMVRSARDTIDRG